MKKKYMRPVLTAFPIAKVNAEGFEPLGACAAGVNVTKFAGFCGSGSADTLPDYSGCSTGSGVEAPSDTTSYCFGGSAPGTGSWFCSSGDIYSLYCFTGGSV